MTLRSGRVLRIAILLGAAAALAGCESMRDATGSAKEPPDEFAIVTKAPLVIPPDYNLRPPKPGAAPMNQVEPTQAAQQALLGADNATVAAAMPGNASMGEKLLLTHAGAQNTDPTIRQDLVADDTALQTSSDSFTNNVLFWQKPATSDAPLDADAAAAQAHTAQPVTAAPPVQPPANTDDQKPDDSNKKTDRGWLDWF
jgi:hypothetical protein